MKKFALLLMVVLTTLSANAQFEKGKKYVNASLSGLGLSYSSDQKFRFGVDLNAGYFISDCLMLRANAGYDHTKSLDDVTVGAGARYYFDQNGIYLGAGLEYAHYTSNTNDLLIPLEVGYAFFINHFITIEPSLYYKMSLDDFSDKSSIGLKIGFGFYF